MKYDLQVFTQCVSVTLIKLHLRTLIQQLSFTSNQISQKSFILSVQPFKLRKIYKRIFIPILITALFYTSTKKKLIS